MTLRRPTSPTVEYTPATLVSVVIPTWNRSAKLQRALSSLRAQTWAHWEALVVDDGSEDDTRDVVAQLAEEDPRIRLIARPHEGVSAARNAGLAEANGGFIAFLDSDNEWQPAFLEAMVGVMTARGLDAAYATLMVMTKAGPRYRAHQVTPAEPSRCQPRGRQRPGGALDTDAASRRLRRHPAPHGRLRPRAAHRRQG